MTIVVCQVCLSRGYVCTTCGKPRSRFALRKRRFDPIHQSCARRPHGVEPCPGDGFDGNPEHRYVRCDYGGEIAFGRRPDNWKHDEARKGEICPACQVKREVALDAIVGGLDFTGIGGKAIDNLIAALDRVDPRKLGLEYRRRLEEATLNFSRRCYQEELEAGMHKNSPPAVLFNGKSLEVKP